MALRDRQISGVPLPWGPAMVISVLMVLCVPWLGYAFWYSLFHIPEELRPWLAVLGMGLQVHRQVGRVPLGMERAQEFFGSYTGISYRAGIYMLPKIPLPLITLLLNTVLGSDIYSYIFWTLVGDVRVESVCAQFVAEGLSRDGLRVRLKGVIVFEIVNVAVFRSQTRDGTDRQTMIDIITAEYIAGLKTSVIVQHTAKELKQGRHSGGSRVLNEWQTQVAQLEKSFGVHLERSPIGEVEILGKRMEKAFDANAGKALLRDVGREYAQAFAEFKAELPPGTSFEVAANMFNAARLDDGLPPVDLNVFQFK